MTAARPQRRPRREFDQREVDAIRNLAKDGLSARQIATRLGRSPTSVARIIREPEWKPYSAPVHTKMARQVAVDAQIIRAGAKHNASSGSETE